MMLDQLSNEDLLAEACRPSEPAAKAFYDRLAPLALLVARNYVPNSDAEDIMISVMRNILNPERAKTIKNVEAYLRTITRNSCLHFANQLTRRNSVEANHLALFFSNSNMESSGSDTLLNEHAEEQYARLYAGLDHLTDGQKECMSLFYFADYSYKEIAAITDRSLKEVKSALQNGKIRLYNYLKHSNL